MAARPPGRLDLSWHTIFGVGPGTDTTTIRSRSPQPAPEPVVYTAGGPGFSSLGQVANFWNSPLLDTHDVILFEQRGTRFDEPALDCPELTAAFIDNLGQNA